MDATLERTDAAPPVPALPRRRGAMLIGAIVGVVAAGVVLGADALRGGVAETDGVRFPESVASYSWLTQPGEPTGAAVIAYQNGFGVESFDSPQMVTVATDARTFRRFTPSEQRSIGADQGDPAQTVLAPDGTFAVIAGADGHGSLRVESFGEGDDRDVSVGDGRSVLPLSIGGDGSRVLVLTSDDAISPYLDMDFRIRGDLELIDLDSGDRTALEIADAGSASLSADGGAVAAIVGSEAVVIDVASGRQTTGTSFGAGAFIPDDAWSPDGTRFTVIDGAGVHLVDAAGAATRVVPSDEDTWASVLGWRDDETLLVQFSDHSNASWFTWVDAATGEATEFATYAPGFTGAAMAEVDAARDLIAEWAVVDVPADQGSIGTVLSAAGIGLVAGALAAAAAAMVARRRRPSVHRDGPLG